MVGVDRSQVLPLPQQEGIGKGTESQAPKEEQEEEQAAAPCRCLALVKAYIFGWASAWSKMNSSGLQVGMWYKEKHPSEPGRRSRTRQQGARHLCSCSGTARSTASTDAWLHKQPWSEEREKRTSGSCARSVPNKHISLQNHPAASTGGFALLWIQLCLTLTELASIHHLSTLNLHRVCSGSTS